MTIEEATAFIAKTTIDHNGPQYWADLGCGSGLFSRALASLLPPDSSVLCVDRSHQNIEATIDTVVLEFKKADFTRLDFGKAKYDGFLMANSLHFIEDRHDFLKRLMLSLKESGRFLIIEYERQTGNQWVPYPISFQNLRELLVVLGFREVTKISERASSYGSMMYACQAIL